MQALEVRPTGTLITARETEVQRSEATQLPFPQNLWWPGWTTKQPGPHAVYYLKYSGHTLTPSPIIEE